MSRVPNSSNVIINGPCGACKFLRRKCIDSCIFAPYFDSEQGTAFFAAVHKIFGASNVSKLLMGIPVYKRPDAVATICFEAQTRIRDPIYGCVAHINSLQQQVVSLQTQVTYLQSYLARLEHSPCQHPGQPEIPQAATLPASYDFSLLFAPNMVSNSQAAWGANQQQLHDRAIFTGAPVGVGGGSGGVGGVGGGSGGGSGGEDIQAGAREVRQRNGGRKAW